MEQNEPGSAASDTAPKEAKDGRTPLKQLSMSRPATSPPSTPLRRRRKRMGGKRTVRSCTSCRAAHVRCVADRYGVPCERCAKKSWLDCTLMQNQQEQAATKSKLTDQPEIIDLSSPQTDDLKQVASDALELLTETEKPGSP